MSHYFHEPKCFKGVNCKQVPGERARKKCREWNKLISKLQKLRREGKIAEAEELERPYIELWEFERELKPPKKKRR
jgi:hypothetical protein